MLNQKKIPLLIEHTNLNVRKIVCNVFENAICYVYLLFTVDDVGDDGAGENDDNMLRRMRELVQLNKKSKYSSI